MTSTTRRHVLAASLLALAGLAHAQDGGAIKMIVPFGPGTTTDTVGRVVAEALSKQLNQAVIVDNRAGPGGSVGTDHATLTQLRTAAANALNQPDVATRLRDQGIEQRAMRADEMLPFNKTELVKWAELVKRSGAQVD